MVLNPEVGKEYEWRRSGKKTQRVKFSGLADAGPGSIQYGNSADEGQQAIPHSTFSVPRTPLVELVEAVIVDDETKQVVTFPKDELFAIE